MRAEDAMIDGGGTAGEARPTVLISGASFAGLATAWWMTRLGYAVTMVEIAAGVRKGGTPVNIREGVVEVVRRMELLERIQAVCLPPRLVTFLDAEGRPLRQADDRQEEAEEDYEIERDELLDMLVGEVEGEVEFLFGDRVTALEERGEGMLVRFGSGAERAFSLVVGCDGTHSAVRRLWFGEEEQFVRFLGHYFSLTIVDRLLLEENTGTMFSVPGKTVMLNAYNGKTDIGFCFYSDSEISYDRRDQAEQKRRIREQFAEGGWRTGELLEAMSGSDTFYFDKLCQVHLPSWSRGRVVLVGDAAYCPSPAAGMGGSVALLGAAALGEALAAHGGDLARAFAAYEARFRPEVEAIQAQAVEVGLSLFMPRTEEAIERRNAMFGLG